jgi:hypothetical protein
MAADRRRHKEFHDKMIANHHAEPLREPWASQTGAALRADFERLAPDAQFRLIDVECRDATCLSTVEWSNYGIALQKWSNILHHAYTTPCGTEVFLDEPEGGGGYRSTVVTICTRAAPSRHAAGAQP